MNILLDIGHPKDINLFANVINLLKLNGHSIKIYARVKENSCRLLDYHCLDYCKGSHFKSIYGKLFGVLFNDIKLYSCARDFKPDVFVSPGSPYSAHVSRLLKKPHLAFSDTEIANLAAKITIPFTDAIYTSTSFYLDFGSKHKKFNGYYELAYLSPTYFKPDSSVLEKYGIKKGYIFVRISSLQSHHDMNAQGLNFKSDDDIKEFVNELEKYGNVFIMSDYSSTFISEHQLNFQPEDFHSLLYYSKLCIGDGASMVSEAAVLGVPSIYVSNTQRGYLNELEAKYGLAFTYTNKKMALNKAKSLLENSNLTHEWQQKREIMLNDSIDVVRFIVESIESVKDK